MDQQEIQINKIKFIDICKKHIHREGLEELLEYLEQTDFYVAPSSSKFHYNEAGGLCKHSINVFETALRLFQNIYETKTNINSSHKDISLESLAICSLFHDLCKINTYQIKEKWKKNNDNQWYSYSSYEIIDNFPLGHGEKSCLILHCYLKLTKEELLAIRWHMGMFDIGEQGSSSRISFYTALRSSPLVAIIHSADFLSSNLLEPIIKI